MTHTANLKVGLAASNDQTRVNMLQLTEQQQRNCRAAAYLAKKDAEKVDQLTRKVEILGWVVIWAMVAGVVVLGIVTR